LFAKQETLLHCEGSTPSRRTMIKINFFSFFNKNNYKFMNKIEEIFNSWKISFNPSSEQADLAIKRIEICDVCEFKSIIDLGPVMKFAKCNVCGCALAGKIYTPKTYKDEGGSCPKNFWETIESLYLLEKENKK
jgi:hypothetical protein